MAKTKKPKKKTVNTNLCAAFIDRDTGNVMGTNLAFVIATEQELDQACDLDRDAFDLSQLKGVTVRTDLMEALLRNDTKKMIKALGWKLEYGPDDELVARTGVFKEDVG